MGCLRENGKHHKLFIINEIESHVGIYHWNEDCTILE